MTTYDLTLGHEHGPEDNGTVASIIDYVVMNHACSLCTTFCSVTDVSHGCWPFLFLLMFNLR